MKTKEQMLKFYNETTDENILQMVVMENYLSQTEKCIRNNFVGLDNIKEPLSNCFVHFENYNGGDDEFEDEGFFSIGDYFLEKCDIKPSQVIEKYIRMLKIYGYDVNVDRSKYDILDEKDSDGFYKSDYSVPLEIILT